MFLDGSSSPCSVSESCTLNFAEEAAEYFASNCLLLGDDLVLADELDYIAGE